MTAVEKRLKAKTLSGYGQMLRLYLLPALGETPLDQLTGKQIKAHYEGLYADNYSRDTVRHVHMVLRQVMAYAFREEFLSTSQQDPMRYVDSVPPRNTEWSCTSVA
jgi:site-specific recombinase XerD